ncbi:hypothetical protein A2U01_0074873 [Trifolium medium]|uniref:Uncharacterized protein n=1 Tax=Trifolium medium TaxID=97028 RepID=A0A392T0C8_9FABA|nr:hypothetical protein [Trifolium medium]
MAECFQVPGENWRQSASCSLPLAGTRSATTQEQPRSLLLARRLAQRPSTNRLGFVAV